MNMKTKYRLLSLLFIFLAVGFSACTLDIVPDEIDTEEDAFKDRTAALRYVYSCYSYLPQARSGPSSLDLMTGDEVVTAFEHETFASFPKGNYSASNTVISYWNTFFQGLRQCYIFLNNVDNVPGATDADKADWIGQVKFLIAYYHFMLIRCYGPTILIQEEPSVTTPAEDYLSRRPLDECVEFVCSMFDEAADALPLRRQTTFEYGLATRVAAKALKAKMRLYAASPLFNGESGFYSNFIDKDGVQLMPTSKDPNKWELCRQAMLEAINVAKEAGHDLYKKTDFLSTENVYPEDPTVHCLRYNIIEPGNTEILFADARDEGSYGIQNKSMPYESASAWNGIAPTWAMLNRFYTKNGLPWDEDPEYKDVDKLSVVTVGEANADEACVGQRTITFNLNREPRFYAWIAFQGGYYDVLSATNNGAYSAEDSYSNGRLVCDFVLGGNCSRGTVSSQRNDYSPTGYLNKKGVSPSNTVSTALKAPYAYPWPIVRLADLYLGYAEACVETNDLSTAIDYLDFVRERAGVPGVETAWSGVATLTQSKLREIVRQERMIELYLENENFWDMRRWLLAGQYFSVQAQGMNIDATTIDDFATLQTVDFERKFATPTNYLLPIPSDDVNRNENLVNNPGY